MCGIAAIVSPQGEAHLDLVRAMCDIVQHRGPDGQGFALFSGNRVWAGDEKIHLRPGRIDDATVAFGHRRLSIIDLSSTGHQPMPDPRRGRYWITFNGEIYNYEELRCELQAAGYIFASSSDTEVILAAYEHWGTSCLPRLNGMFVFIIFDREEQRLFAARDRYGVKPLYWWRNYRGMLALASEIKQFTVLPGWRPRLSGQRTYDYLNWGLTDHTDETMFAGIMQLKPGYYITSTLDELRYGPEPRCWYDLDAVLSEDHASSDEEAIHRWRDLFFSAVKYRLRADVPVGTALSGGLDSSSIVCAVDALLPGSTLESRKAFSARSSDPALDEGEYMLAVARRAGVDHHVTWPNGRDLLPTLPELIWHMDEPFGSSSVFAEWTVFKLVASTAVKVTLDGHGADEILAGYQACAGPYLAQFARQFHPLQMITEWRAMAGGHQFDILAQVTDHLAPRPVRDLLRRLGGQTVLRPDWLDLERLNAEPDDPFSIGRGNGIRKFSVAQMTATSLPMQLRWNDRNSMAHSIESRAPFLDYRLVEHSLALPDQLKIRGGLTKIVLRQALQDILPIEILQRRSKIGFATAEEGWVRHDHRSAFSAALRQSLESGAGVFSANAAEHFLSMADARRPYHSSFWRVLCFGAWMEKFGVQA